MHRPIAHPPTLRRIGSGRRAGLTGLLAVLALTAPGLFGAVAQASPVYVDVNEASQVAVIDSATNQPIGAPFDTAPIPQKLSITPDGRYLYLAHTVANMVTVVDTTTGKQVGPPIPVGEAPTGIAITPDGRFAYVSNNNDSTVSVIDIQAHAVVKTITGFDFSDDVAIAPDGSTVYVANAGGHDVSIVSTATNQIVGSIPVAGGQDAITISPDGRYVYTANESADSVSVVDTATRAVVGTPIPAGELPFAIATTPDGSTVYVSDFGSHEVTVIDAATRTAETPITVGKLPAGLAVTPDGRSLYVAEENAESVAVIDTAKNTPITSITGLGHTPEDIVIAPDQPPSASFTAAPVARPGVPVGFDASGSSDPDGTIASYSWSFGDGSGAAGGLAQSHVFAKPGTYSVTLTLADETGCSTSPIYDGHEDFCNGGPAATRQEAIRVAYPSVRVACPKRASKAGCRVKLTVVKKGRRKGRRKPPLKPETAVARAKLKRGKSALVPIVPKPAFRAKLATAHNALFREVLVFKTKSGRERAVKVVSKRVF